MTDLRTVPFRADDEPIPAQATSCEVAVFDASPAPSFLVKARHALTSLALATVVSTAPLCQDISRRERGAETSTVIAPTRPSAGRRVSLAEARRIALAVMAEAEARRAAFAEEEAAREAVWEERA